MDCFFDAESIGWGDNWVKALERAIDECTDIVFVLSPDFCNSEWSQIERTSAIADDPANLKRKARPLMLHDCPVPRFLKQIQTINVSTQALFDANYPKICHALGGVFTPSSKLSTVLNSRRRNRCPNVTACPIFRSTRTS